MVIANSFTLQAWKLLAVIDTTAVSISMVVVVNIVNTNNKLNESFMIKSRTGAAVKDSDVIYPFNRAKFRVEKFKTLYLSKPHQIQK